MIQPGPDASLQVTLKNAVVIDGTGAEPVTADVRVADGLIQELGPSLPAPAANGRVIDCTGLFLLPGLIDAHTHHGAIDDDVTNQHRRYYTGYASILIARRITDTLEQGFTTARDAAGIDAGFRLAVEHGLMAGPRLLVSSRPISQTGGHGDHRLATETIISRGCEVGQLRVIADGVDEVRKAVRENLRRGADQIKIFASGGVISPTDRLASSQYTAEEIGVMCQEAATAGTYCLAHAYTPEAIVRCVEAGVRSIEHGNLLDQRTAALMAEHGTFLVPTLAAHHFAIADVEAGRKSPEYAEKAKIVAEAGLCSIEIAKSAGVAICSGSDLLGPRSRHLAKELSLKSQVLSPSEVITATTLTNARLLSLDQRIGTLEVGKEADLIAVSGNPLSDISILENRSNLRLIMKRGRVYKEAIS